MNMAKPAPSEATQFTVNHQPPITIRRKSPYSQALELQDLLMKDARQAEIKPVARAIVARAWRDLEAMKREITMKPKPKPIDVDSVALAKRARRAGAGVSLFPEPVSCPPRLRTGAGPSGQESATAD
jgi:hypothetical protein